MPHGFHRSLLFALLVASPAASQGEPGTGPLTGETIVTATRSEDERLEVPWSTDAVGSRRLRERAYRTMPQALRDVPGVMVQETSHGQGSPFIRGFTGFRNVMLIDGIRLNNSVFRDGPNQYWNTIDPFSLERLEVVRGPGSVLWGSDAIGGTVNALTRSPYTYDEGGGDGVRTGGRAYYRVASAEESHIGRVEGSLTQGDRFGLLLGGTGKHFGDLQGGVDIGTQPNTGYDEWDADLKAETFLDAATSVTFAYQHVKQNDVPRTHSTIFADPFEGTTVGSDLRRDLDQERELAYVQLHGAPTGGAVDDYRLSLSWHRQQEMRDRIRGSGAREMQGFDVGTLGLFAHASAPTPLGRLTWGADWYHDDVDSFSSTNAIQGPIADDASYDLLGVFLQDEIEATSRLSFTLGARFDYAAADADKVFDPVGMTQISIEDDWTSVVGSARFVYRLAPETERVNLFGGVSQGFRAPNLSDLTRFDSARTNEFEIPSPGLDPEEYLTWELGVKTESETCRSELAVYYTDVEDQIVRFPTGNVNGAGEFEITKDNVGDGYLWGAELGTAWRFAPAWTVFGNAAFVRGRVDTFPTSAPVVKAEYVDRLAPFTTQLGLRWDASEDRHWAELAGVWADDADKLSTRDANDTSRIPPGGTPGYLVFHLRAGKRLTDRLRVDAAVENLTDEDYRIHGSGQNMPGRNFVLGLSLSL